MMSFADFNVSTWYIFADQVSFVSVHKAICLTMIWLDSGRVLLKYAKIKQAIKGSASRE